MAEQFHVCCSHLSLVGVVQEEGGSGLHVEVGFQARLQSFLSFSAAFLPAESPVSLFLPP